MKKKTNIKMVKPKLKKVTRPLCSPKGNCSSCGGAIYGLGFVGALVYYISTERDSGLVFWE